MSFQKELSNLHSHSNNSSLQTTNMENIPIETLFESRIRIKRSRSHENLTVSKPVKDSKKKVSISAQNQDGKVLKENKSSTNSNSKVCYCSPTTHEGSFKCRLHRINATKKSAPEKLINVRCSKFANKEFKPQLSRFGRVAFVKYGSQLNSTMESS